MTDYIKRIQSRLSSKGTKIARSEIIEEIKVFGFDPENLSNESTDLITVELLDKFIISPSPEKNENNLFNSPTDHTPSDSNHPNEKINDFEEINKINSETLTSGSEINKINSPFFTAKSGEINSSEIVVSPEIKQELITVQALCLGIELSEVEVIELANGIGDRFNNYADFIQETTSAIKSYADHRYDSLERKIQDTNEDLKTHFKERERQLNQKFAAGLGEIKSALGVSQDDLKRTKSIILKHFAIPAKT